MNYFMQSFYNELEKQAKVITPLQEHQQEVVAKIMDVPGLLVWHGLGAGKTLSSLAVADELGLPTEVIVPASLQENYKKEIQKHLSPKLKTKIDITSYDKLLRNIDKYKGTGLLVIDEAHRIRNPKSKRADTLLVLGGEAKKRLALTGTPIYNHPVDIATQIDFVAGENILPSNKKDFEDAYINFIVRKPNILARLLGVKPGSIAKIKNKEKLKELITPYISYYEQNEANYPEIVYKNHEVEMTPTQQKYYNYMMDKIPWHIKYKIQHNLPPSKTESKQLNAYLQGTRIVSNTIGPYKENIVMEEEYENAPKIRAIIEDIQKNRGKDSNFKALVYSNFLGTIGLMDNKLNELNIPHKIFTGQETQKQKKEAVEQYNKNEIPVLMVSTAGGEGLDLMETQKVYITEPHWNAEKIRQVVGRAARFRSHENLPSTKQKVTVEQYYAVPRPGIFAKLGLVKDKGVDKYLKQLSDQKDELKQEFLKVLKIK